MFYRQFEYQMPYGEYAYPFGSNVSFGQNCPFCGAPLGEPFGGMIGPGMGDPFGGMFGPGMGDPFGGGVQCPYGGNPWWR